MRIFAYIIFLCLPLLTTATIYKSYDKAGNPVFSDTYTKGATEVEIGASQTYNETQRSSSSISEKPVSKTPPATAITYKKYEKFKIVQPIDDYTIRQSEKGVGIIQITVAIKPALQENDTIIYYLDGNQVLGPTTATSVNLTDVNRGRHSLQAKIIRIDSDTEKTKVVVSSNKIIVHLKSSFKRPIIQPLNPGLTPIEPANKFRPLTPAGPLAPLKPAGALPTR